MLEHQTGLSPTSTSERHMDMKPSTIVAPIGANPETAPAERVTKLEAFTVEQYRRVCETIAGRAATLCDLLRMLQGSGAIDDWEASIHLDAAAIVAVGIGAMADEATGPGGDVLGDWSRWNYGPNFADAGKEVRHG